MILSLLTAVVLAVTPLPKKEYVEYRARITFYSHNSDKYGSRVADPTIKRAKQGITVAAHPDFKFGTEIEIPELKQYLGDTTYTVQDRGSAVTKKRASRGKAYVFDVYVEDPKLIRKFYTIPEYMTVRVKK